jgi:nucleoside-diphosphate-sugar epimerase
VRGDLKNLEVLKEAAREADAVVHTAFIHDFADYDGAVAVDREVTKAFAEVLRDSNKPFVATTGSAFLGDTGDAIADENYPFDQNSPFLSRGEAERDVLQLSSKGIRSIVLRLPLMVYGRSGSAFVPFVIEQAKKTGAASYFESGERRVSAVHVDDAAELYLLALETSTGKGLYNVAAESVSLRELSESVARLLDLKAVSVPAEKAREQFGPLFGFLSISNQLSAAKARAELGWSPNDYHSIRDDIENGSYRKFKE